MKTRKDEEHKLKPHKQIAYLLSQFPEIHETFILREIIELEKNEIDIKLFSLKKCKDGIVHPQAKNYLTRTQYSSLLSLKTVHALIYFFCYMPIQCLKLIIYILKKNYSSLEHLVKSLAVIPISLYYARLIQAYHIDHIHAHWATVPATSALIISKILDIPYSFTAHAWDIFLTNPMLIEKVRGAEFVITCTGYNKRYLNSMLTGEQEGKVIKNYHGIDFDTLPKIRKKIEDTLIFSIGRLCEQKGFPYLLEAIGILKNRGHIFKCIIVGEGPDRKMLTQKIEELGIQNEIELPGLKPQSYIFELFNRARMFVLPCVISKNGDRDGIPNVMIEALAMRTPVISTTVSGVPEIIKNGETGITVEPRNANKLADAIQFLYEHQELSQKFTENGRKLVEQEFDVKKNVRELAKIFLEQTSL